jgi:hypothetical protein
MDVIAHALWAGAAAQWLRDRRPAMSGRIVAATVVVAVLPDVLPLAPAVAWSFSEPAPLQFLYDNITALPGDEPEMPAFVHELSHHLHCILHSVIVAGAATALLWWARPQLVLPLLGSYRARHSHTLERLLCGTVPLSHHLLGSERDRLDRALAARAQLSRPGRRISLAMASPRRETPARASHRTKGAAHRCRAVRRERKERGK